MKKKILQAGLWASMVAIEVFSPAQVHAQGSFVVDNDRSFTIPSSAVPSELCSSPTGCVICQQNNEEKTLTTYFPAAPGTFNRQTFFRLGSREVRSISVPIVRQRQLLVPQVPTFGQPLPCDEGPPPTARLHRGYDYWFVSWTLNS